MFKEIEQAWTEDSGIYDDLIQKQLSNQRDVRHWTNTLKRFIGPPKGKRVLDVGTGPGFFSVLLARSGYQVTAADGSEGMVRQAERNFQNQHVKVELFCSDVVRLEEFPPNSFDAIVSRDVVWTLYDPETAYRRWMEILKPGGRLIVFDGNYRMDRNSLHIRLWKKLAGLLTWIKEGKREKTKVNEEGESVFRDLPLVTVERPEKDRELLTGLGYQILGIGWDRYRNSLRRWSFWTGGYQGKTFQIVAKMPRIKNFK